MKIFSRTILIATLLLSGCAATDTRRSTGEVIDDATISTGLKARLLRDPVTDGLDIEIEINRGQVQLNGFADSEAERRRAEEIANNIRGVKSVTNNLRVADSTRRVGEYVDDKVLVTRVNAALVRAPDVRTASIEVEVNKGVVTLGGFVETETERSAAENAAKGVPGIAQIVNNLELRRR